MAGRGRSYYTIQLAFEAVRALWESTFDSTDTQLGLERRTKISKVALMNYFQIIAVVDAIVAIGELVVGVVSAASFVEH